MGSIGSSELFVIFLVILLLFGSKQLPDIARKVGKGLRDFQNASQQARDEINKMMRDENDTDHKHNKQG
jgi:sec-independent protein translocase protein TatA